MKPKSKSYLIRECVQGASLHRKTEGPTIRTCQGACGARVGSYMSAFLADIMAAGFLQTDMPYSDLLVIGPHDLLEGALTDLFAGRQLVLLALRGPPGLVRTSQETSIRTSLERSIRKSLERSIQTSLETSVRTSPETSVRTSRETPVRTSLETCVRMSQDRRPYGRL